MKLQNIFNKWNTIYYTLRENDKLIIKEVHDFYPYFYELDPNGDHISFDGKKLTQICVKNPHEIKKLRSPNSYEADVHFVKRYLIDKVPQITKSKTRYILFDIETPIEDKKYLDPRFTKESPYPITIIVAYDNYTKEYTEYDMRDYTSEFDMLEAMCKQIKEASPDMLLAWNILNFDYPYMFYRFPELAQKLSPINEDDWREPSDIRYPALISVVDLMALDHKFTLGKRESYAADNVCMEEFEGEESWGETDFINDIDKVKAKCLNDVKRMVRLIEKNDYIEYFDQTRLDTGCLWEDLPSKKVGFKWQSNNSKPIDLMFLREAKKLNIVLPNKPKREDPIIGAIEEYGDDEKAYDGAYREIFKKGIFNNCLGKYDLGSAYPTAIMDFCLDPANIGDKDGLEIDLYRMIGEEKQDIDTYKFKQNQFAILPVVVKKLLTTKNELKALLGSIDPSDSNYKTYERQYDSCKARINSLYGVLGNPYFRLHDRRVAETDTFLIRDLLLFVKNKLKALGYEVIYIDTDSVFIRSDKDLSSLLNRFVIEWGMDKYNKKVNIKFDYEGQFARLFLVALCRYIGEVRKTNGKLKPEVKGLQMKRKDATLFVKEFQEKILNYIMDGHSDEEIFSEITEWINKLKTVDLITLGHPCKFSKNREDYKKQEIFFRALDNTKVLIPTFNKEIDQKFWWIQVSDECEVLAFDKDNQSHIKNLDDKLIIETQIMNVLVPIFEGLDKGKELVEFATKYDIVLKSDFRNRLLSPYANCEELIKYYSANAVKARKKALLPQPEKKVKKLKKKQEDLTNVT